MMEIFQNLTDNQTAVLLMIAGLSGSFLLLSASFYANPANREASREQPQIRQLPVAPARAAKKAA